jgi:outer membrane receptor protein involved in Fe transport
LTILGNNNGAGKKLNNAPKYQWSASAEYTDHLMGDFDYFARVDYSHRGAYFIDYANVAKVGHKENVNLRVGMRSDKFTFEAYVKNLTNDKTALGATKGPEALYTPATGQEIRVALPDKRWMGVRASYNF